MHLNHSLDPKIFQHYSPGFTLPKWLRIVTINGIRLCLTEICHVVLTLFPLTNLGLSWMVGLTQRLIFLFRLMCKHMQTCIRADTCWSLHTTMGLTAEIRRTLLYTMHNIGKITISSISMLPVHALPHLRHKIYRISQKIRDLHTRQIHQCDNWKLLQVLRWGGLDSCRMYQQCNRLAWTYSMPLPRRHLSYFCSLLISSWRIIQSQTTIDYSLDYPGEHQFYIRLTSDL